MKEWIFPILITAILTVLIPVILPNGEKSPLFLPLKLLLSLALTLSVFLPVVSFSKSGIETSSLFSYTVSNENYEKILLEKAEADIASAVKSAFPEEEVSVEVLANEDFIPTGIHFVCQSREEGEKISVFLEKNFSLIATYTIKEETL